MGVTSYRATSSRTRTCQTRGAVSVEQLKGMVALLDDPTSPLEGEPITMTITTAFEQIPLTMLRDPWDRLITATVMTPEVPLVTADAKSAGRGWSRQRGSYQSATTYLPGEQHHRRVRVTATDVLGWTTVLGPGRSGAGLRAGRRLSGLGIRSGLGGGGRRPLGN